jgi:subtilisin-like proprotein convertase family protein
MKIFSNNFVKATFAAAILMLFVFTSQRALLQDLKFDGDGKNLEQREETSEIGTIPVNSVKGRNSQGKSAPIAIRPSVGTDQGTESEPNGTFGTADVLTGTEGKIKANAWSEIFATDGTDTDFYAITIANPNTKVYAAVQTSFSASGTDSTLDLIASDGSTVLENDLNDGTFGGSSSSISGANILIPGTYYLRVTNVATATPISNYDLYFALKDATPTAETEPNNNGGTPNPIPASGLMSGSINPAADNDTFSIALNAGDTAFISLNIDPERDTVQWNGRTGMGLFGTPNNFLVISDGSVGSVTNPLSEAFFMTVRTAGTYVVYVDEPAGGGGATFTYTLNVTVIPPETCTTFTNAVATPIADAALTSSTINVPGSPIAKKVRAFLNISHTLTTDLDIHLVSPANNDNGLVTDVATVATQTVQYNFGLDDDAGIPAGSFTVNSGMIWQPELSYRMNWFSGENAGGDWRLDIRDDTATNTGTLNSWSLEVCTDPAPSGNLIYNQNFEASNGGYTHSGVADEWEYGTPATVATSGGTPIAGFTNCASGTNCWKTDLDNTYDLSSTQDLTSPTLNLTQYPGTIKLYWQQRYQMENVSFDRIWVRVTEVGVPANTRIVWQNSHATMTDFVGVGGTTNIPASAGWGRYNADISDFAGKLIQVNFHLDSDNSINFGGLAIDDVQLYHVGVVAASVPVGGRVMNAAGNGISRATVTLTPTGGGETRTAITNSFGYYGFDDVQVGQNYIIQVSNKRYSFDPQVVFVTEEMQVNFTANP